MRVKAKKIILFKDTTGIIRIINIYEVTKSKVTSSSKALSTRFSICPSALLLLAKAPSPMIAAGH
jgi:hypothetical protein